MPSAVTYTQLLNVPQSKITRHARERSKFHSDITYACTGKRVTTFKIVRPNAKNYKRNVRVENAIVFIRANERVILKYNACNKCVGIIDSLYSVSRLISPLNRTEVYGKIRTVLLLFEFRRTAIV